MTGVLLVDKPAGITSAGVLRALAPRLGRAKLGHVGTLDPFASGLLPLCVGAATKIARWLLTEEKTYTGTIRLGVATDTLDRTGATTMTADVPPFDEGVLERLAVQSTGAQQQIPPMFSALKRAGVPLYVLARRGIEVERAARAIVIRRLVLQVAGRDGIDFLVECSKGTYVRVLAADLACALGTVGHLDRLRRTAVGAFRVEAALPLSALQAGTGPLPLIGLREALAGCSEIAVSRAAAGHLRQGRQEVLATLPCPGREGEVAVVLDPDGGTVAVIEATAGSRAWRLARVLDGS